MTLCSLFRQYAASVPRHVCNDLTKDKVRYDIIVVLAPSRRRHHNRPCIADFQCSR